MSEHDTRDDRDEFDWHSPRWREGDEPQGDVERRRRFHDNAPPDERGALDRDGSVGRESPKRGPGEQA